MKTTTKDRLAAIERLRKRGYEVEPTEQDEEKIQREILKMKTSESAAQGGQGMKVATWIKDLDGFTGHAALYRLSHKLEGHTYVVVSATVAPFTGSETYIFPASAKGKVKDYGELKGSMRHVFSHEAALNSMDYNVLRPREGTKKPLTPRGRLK